MVETTSKEQNTEKRMKRTEDISETSGTILNTPTFEYRGPRRIKEKERI